MTWMALAALVTVMTTHLVDDGVMLFVMSSHSSLIHAMKEVTDVGLSQWYVVPAALLFVGLAFLDRSAWARPARLRLAFLYAQAGYAFAAISFAGITTETFKFLIGRARPTLFDQGGSLHFEPLSREYDFNSFPSGHSTTMGAAAVILALWFPKARVPVFLLCACAATTRVAAQAHYPSDVVAGFAVGLFCALFLARWLALRRVAFRFRNNDLFPIPRFRLLPGKRRDHT